MRFLVDMALSPKLADWLRAQGHDAIHAAALGMNRASDLSILQAAGETGQVVITADLDFPRLLALVGTGGPGLILLRGGNYKEDESLDCVRRVLAAVSPQDISRSIVVVDRERIRRRDLPI